MASQHVGVVDTKDARHLDLAKVWIREPDLRNRIAVHLHDDIRNDAPDHLMTWHAWRPLVRIAAFNVAGVGAANTASFNTISPFATTRPRPRATPHLHSSPH